MSAKLRKIVPLSTFCGKLCRCLLFCGKVLPLSTFCGKLCHCLLFAENCATVYFLRKIVPLFTFLRKIVPLSTFCGKSSAALYLLWKIEPLIYLLQPGTYIVSSSWFFLFTTGEYCPLFTPS
jgi:hypothetical protein